MLQKSSPYSNCANAVSFWVFDPGGISRIEGVTWARLYCVAQPNFLGKSEYMISLANIIWVFDPGGIGRSIPGLLTKVLLLLLTTLFLILEDKDRFK